jgi:hypothetical protein
VGGRAPDGGPEDVDAAVAVDRPDLIVAGCELPRREREDRVGSVERYDALHVARAARWRKKSLRSSGRFAGSYPRSSVTADSLGPGCADTGSLSPGHDISGRVPRWHPAIARNRAGGDQSLAQGLPSLGHRVVAGKPAKQPFTRVGTGPRPELDP